MRVLSTAESADAPGGRIDWDLGGRRLGLSAVAETERSRLTDYGPGSGSLLGCARPPSSRARGRRCSVALHQTAAVRAAGADPRPWRYG